MPDDLFSRKTGNPDRAYVHLMLRRAAAELRAPEDGGFCSCTAREVFARDLAAGGLDHAVALHYMFASHALHLFLPHDAPNVSLRKVLAGLRPVNGCLLKTTDPLKKVQKYLWPAYPRCIDPIFFAMAIGELLYRAKPYQVQENLRRNLNGGSVHAEVIVAAALPDLLEGSAPQPNAEGQELWRKAYKTLLNTPVLPPLKGGLWEISVRVTNSKHPDEISITDLLRNTDQVQTVLAAALPTASIDGEARVVVSEILRLANTATDLREAFQHAGNPDDLPEFDWIFDADSLSERLNELDGLSVQSTEFGPRVVHE